MTAGIKFKLGPPAAGSESADAHRAQMAARYTAVRAGSEHLAAPLSPEDQILQSMPDASPTKWHLAHTTWFFETFLLQKFSPQYTPFHPDFGFLFNSYYHTVGAMHARPRRGLLSRPSVEEVRAYRAHVDKAMRQLIDTVAGDQWADVSYLVTVGLNHEQQHQELLLTDIRHAFSMNPILPAAYPPGTDSGSIVSETPPPPHWIEFEGGVAAIGHEGSGFAFDNETPRHDTILRPFALASRPVSNGEYLAFVQDGGYDTVTLWLSDGWATVQEQAWRHPLYWRDRDGTWTEFTLGGERPLDPAKPVTSISLYEAAAFAAWAGKRLPGEAEWEHAASGMPIKGNLLHTDGPIARAPEPLAAPMALATDDRLTQLYGDVWEWTASPYAAYPGFRPLEGSLGEYNGKFMCNQTVLRGGSCATPQSHIRATYRNFFPPDARWQFSGIRLASDAP